MTETREMGRPEIGFWMVKLTKNGAEVPASIFWCDHEPGLPENKVDQPYLDGEAAGERIPPEDVWHRRGRSITEDEYRFQLADVLYCKQHLPSDPKANPKEKVNLRQVALPF